MAYRDAIQKLSHSAYIEASRTESKTAYTDDSIPPFNTTNIDASKSLPTNAYTEPPIHSQSIRIQTSPNHHPMPLSPNFVLPM